MILFAVIGCLDQGYSFLRSLARAAVFRFSFGAAAIVRLGRKKAGGIEHGFVLARVGVSVWGNMMICRGSVIEGYFSLNPSVSIAPIRF